jgi:hypothetical protein
MTNRTEEGPGAKMPVGIDRGEAGHWDAPRAAWALARDTAGGQGSAAVKDIPGEARPDVIIALGAQLRSFLADAARRGVTGQPDPMAWAADVPHARLRQLASDALRGERSVRVPARLCVACTAAMLGKMTGALLDVMSDAGVPRRDLQAMLGRLASRAAPDNSPREERGDVYSRADARAGRRGTRGGLVPARAVLVG